MKKTRKRSETTPERKSTSERIEAAIKAKLEKADLESLPLETLASLLQITRPGSGLLSDKKDCKCKVVEVDDSERAAKGWQCKCQKVGLIVMFSFKGPKMGGWASCSPPFGMEGDNNYCAVTDPKTGENFKVEYQFECD